MIPKEIHQGSLGFMGIPDESPGNCGNHEESLGITRFSTYHLDFCPMTTVIKRVLTILKDIFLVGSRYRRTSIVPDECPLFLY